MTDILKFTENKISEEDWDAFGKGLDLTEEEKQEAEMNAEVREANYDATSK